MIFYASHLTMPVEKGIKFHVSEAGRQKVLRERVKNVHAWVNGYIQSYIKADIDTKNEYLILPSAEESMAGEENQITYNPYLHPWFFWKMDGKKVDETMGCDLYGRKLVFTDKGTMHRVPF